MSTLTATPKATQCRAANRMTCRHHGQPLVVNHIMTQLEDNYGNNIFRGDAGTARLRELEKLVELVSRYPNASRDVFTVRHELRERMHEFRTLDVTEPVDSLIDDIAYMQIPNAEEAEQGLPHKRGSKFNPFGTTLSIDEFFNRG